MSGIHAFELGSAGSQATPQGSFCRPIDPGSAPNLWAKPRHPYYIVSPSYRENSAGVYALHLLCHALNLQGFEAYVTSKDRNARLRTPSLTPAIEQEHARIGNTPITVYPETISGNPRKSPVVARFLLNKPGLLAGDASFPDSEVLFVYSTDFLPPGMKAEVLLVPVFDLSLFNSKGIDESTRQGRYFYANHYVERGGVLMGCTSDCVELSQKNPRSLSQLAALFRSAECLYSYEISGICTEAMLCGCPVIYLPSEQMTTFPLEQLIGRDGAAWGDSPEEIDRARATVRLVFDKIKAIQQGFWSQLETFINLTQAAAEGYQQSMGLSTTSFVGRPDWDVDLRHYLRKFGKRLRKSI